MIAEHAADDDFENFLERAQSAGKGDEGVTPLFEEVLAFAHAVGDDEVVAFFIADSVIHQKAWRDAGYFPAGGAGGVGENAHATDVVAAVHEDPILFSDRGAEVVCGTGVNAVDVAAGGAVDGDGPDRTHRAL